MNHIEEIFGRKVFNEAVMQQRLPADVYSEVISAMKEGRRLGRESADVIADAMKDWAVENGATHFTHWFQPMTGITAEKHDSFLNGSFGEEKSIELEFSGKALISGESDASSFPSGGLRATFEARGYTAWDPTSYAFIKDNVLCIPTAFCSYGGEALDKKTPLLRSMEALNKQGLRIMKLFGMDGVKNVRPTVGAEQEYFLVDKSVYDERKDLIFTGRTLFGALPPKGQELADHYYGTIKPRVADFMKDLDDELWSLGIMAKTEHNEAAPAQHELAPFFTTANIAVDHNQLTMEIMQKVARRHNMVCLLHEKPFQGINGSGKHNNWSLITDTGINLIEPGNTPAENARFLLFFCAVLQAVDDYQDLLRLSVSSAGNDCRTCGTSEAPPAIISMYVGEEMEGILSAIENDMDYGLKDREEFKVGVHVLPKFPKDTTDRNRTSPFCFTGNKFEFRMPGSMQSLSGPNVVLNTAVAESLRQYADILEEYSGTNAAGRAGNADTDSADANGIKSTGGFDFKLHELLKKVISAHKRIIFNGNNYGAEWEKEAARRGLLNLKSLPDCAPCYVSEKNLRLFAAHKIYTEAEVRARYEIKLSSYSKILNIEALTMLNMVRREILPAAAAFSKVMADSANSKLSLAAAAGLSAAPDCSYEIEIVSEISSLIAEAYRKTEKLSDVIKAAGSKKNAYELARFYRDSAFSTMNDLRETVDRLERRTDREYWPVPTYGDILFSVS